MLDPGTLPLSDAPAPIFFAMQQSLGHHPLGLPDEPPRKIATMRWEPARALPADAAPSFGTVLARGARNRCPHCGEGRIFDGYLKVVSECSVCHTPLGELPADDAPPYFTIFLVGHLLVPFVFWIEKAYQPPMWLHMAVWLPLFTLLSMAALRPIKGATVGWMYRLGVNEEAVAATVRETPRPVPRPDA